MGNINRELGKMRSLIERMERHHTGFQALLNEEMHINEGVVRRMETPDKVFEVLDGIGKNSYVCIGYVASANVDLPKVKRRNPESGRMKSYDDFESFTKEMGASEPIAALVSINSYNFRYYNTNDFDRNYEDYKSRFNDVRAKYGIDPVADKENNYVQKIDYGNGVKAYGGNNDSKKGHFYVNANTFGSSKKSVTYAVNGEGHIIQELTKDQLVPYVSKKAGSISGVKALRELGAEEDVIARYIEDVKNLKFKFKQFTGDCILWIAASVNGEKIVYINSNMKRCVNGIDVDPSDFVQKAMERYEVETDNIPQN